MAWSYALAVAISVVQITIALAGMIITVRMLRECAADRVALIRSQRNGDLLVVATSRIQQKRFLLLAQACVLLTGLATARVWGVQVVTTTSLSIFWIVRSVALIAASTILLCSSLLDQHERHVLLERWGRSSTGDKAESRRA